ncbi:MAG: TonB-dependent receptor plug domain-containing protein, partial [Chitinophagaceae bacterium]|nr:TonB-dependent receptor plug domain-containing protein [Chitinophagaceae bacterium]
MKKIACGTVPYGNGSLIKYLLMTKFSIILIVAFSMQSFASSYGQENLNLKMEKVALKKVLKAIEEQSSYRFVYKDEILPTEQVVSISVKNAKISDVLNKVLQNTSLNYRMLGENLIVIVSNSAPELTGLGAFVRVAGKVITDTGEPLAGVSIVEKGTTNGTSTDAQGNFGLEVSSATATLVFSTIGFETQEVPISSRTEITITMAAAAASLNDVVVIGYQTVRRRDVTGAVGVVNTENTGRIVARSFPEALQGASPGVSVRNGGAPGQEAVVNIRGLNTFSGNANPLYIIDGMYADANTTVNPNDIESVQVLKDASAAAIYGSRAANGVIIITTKKGREGPLKVSAAARYSISQIPKRYDMMNGPEYVAMSRAMFEASGYPLQPAVANYNGT